MAVLDLDRKDRSDFHLRFIDRDRELPAGRLRTPRERNGRVRLDEDCTSDAAIPRKEEFGANRRHALGHVDWVHSCSRSIINLGPVSRASGALLLPRFTAPPRGSREQIREIRFPPLLRKGGKSILEKCSRC